MNEMAKTILAVDDSGSLRQMVAFSLKAAGYDVVQAVDGQDGLNKAKEKTVDLVLTDQNMPIMDGWQFLDEYKKTKKVTPEKTTIYLVSSSDSISDVNKAKEYQDQIKDFFFKPMKAEDLCKIF